MYLRRCSTVSRTSQLGCLNQPRSFSMTTKLSELMKGNKRYASGRQSSFSDPEQSIPFTCNMEAPSVDIREQDENEAMPREPEVTRNESDTCKADELELKINVVNIECQTRDGLSRNTTSLDIHALKNGCTINSENILNNNIHETVLGDTVPHDKDAVS